MGKKKKKKRKKLPESPLLAPDDENLLSRLLEKPKEIPIDNIPEYIKSPDIARALLDKLPAENLETIDLVLAIRKSFDQKEVQKAVKKALFRFRQKGILVPEASTSEENPIFTGTVENDEPGAFLSPIDGFGSRAVFITVPQLPSGFDIGLGIVNDEQGIVEFMFGKYSKKKMKEVKEIFFNQTGELLETSIEHAATVLERAYGLNNTEADESTRAYLQLRPWILENVSLLEKPVVYDLIPPGSIPEVILTPSKIDKLLEHEMMKSWLIAPEKIQPLMEEIKKAEESPILISEDQKAGRISEIKESALTDIFPDSMRDTLKNRLEETAFIMFKSGEEEFALLAIAAAHSLKQKDSIFVTNPFLTALLDRNLDLYLEAAEKFERSEDTIGKESPSIIVP